MQLFNAECFIFLMITICSSCIRSETQYGVEESQPDRRIHKREATVLIENIPFDRILQKSKMVYRRLSQHRYVQPKSKYGPPKGKHESKLRRSPPKKFRRRPNMPKRALQNYKNRPTKPRYGTPQKPNPALVYRPHKKPPTYTYFSPVSSSYAEPPVYDYRPTRQTADAEPPVDAYGEQINPVYEDVYTPAPNYSTTTNHLDNEEFIYKENYKSWVDFASGKNTDSAYDYSKMVPVRTKPDAPIVPARTKPEAPNVPVRTIQDAPIYVTPAPIDNYDDIVMEQEPSKPKQSYYSAKKRTRVSSNPKIVKKPWRLRKKPTNDEEIIVGGQYAEPPARFAAPMYNDYEEFSLREPFDAVLSASSSPYVNYKNTNMAFSPQNLNDAFSITDK